MNFGDNFRLCFIPRKYVDKKLKPLKSSLKLIKGDIECMKWTKSDMKHFIKQIDYTDILECCVNYPYCTGCGNQLYYDYDDLPTIGDIDEIVNSVNNILSSLSQMSKIIKNLTECYDLLLSMLQRFTLECHKNSKQLVQVSHIYDDNKNKSGMIEKKDIYILSYDFTANTFSTIIKLIEIMFVSLKLFCSHLGSIERNIDTIEIFSQLEDIYVDDFVTIEKTCDCDRDSDRDNYGEDSDICYEYKEETHGVSLYPITANCINILLRGYTDANNLIKRLIKLTERCRALKNECFHDVKRSVKSK